MNGASKIFTAAVGLILIFAAMLALTGCPTGTSLALTSDGIHAFDNCWPQGPATSPGGRYVPIGGTVSWLLINPRDHDAILQPGGNYLILPDSVPDDKIQWSFVPWAQPQTAIGPTVTVRAIDSPYANPYPGPDTRCTFDDLDGPPYTNDAPNISTYNYTDVILPSLHQECAHNRAPGGPDFDYGIQIKVMDIGGAQSTISWSHCSLDETNLCFDYDGCNFAQYGVIIGGSRINSNNMFGDRIHVPNWLQQQQQYTCTSGYYTDWSISSGGPWHLLETVRYAITISVSGGQRTVAATRKNQNVSAMPVCAGPL